jgi:hypothetical protein
MKPPPDSSKTPERVKAKLVSDTSEGDSSAYDSGDEDSDYSSESEN